MRNLGKSRIIWGIKGAYMRLKKYAWIVLVCVFCLSNLFAIFFFSCRKQTFDLTMTGYRASSEEGTVEIRVNDELCGEA